MYRIFATLVAITTIVGVASAGSDNRSTEDAGLLSYLGFYMDPDPILWTRADDCIEDLDEFQKIREVFRVRIVCNYFHTSGEFMLSVSTVNPVIDTEGAIVDFVTYAIGKPPRDGSGTNYTVSNQVPEKEYQFPNDKSFGVMGEWRVATPTTIQGVRHSSYFSYFRADWLAGDDILIVVSPSNAEPASSLPMLEEAMDTFFHFAWENVASK